MPSMHVGKCILKVKVKVRDPKKVEQHWSKETIV